FRRLPRQKSSRSNAGIQFHIENKSRARYVPFNSVDFEIHRCAIESGVIECLSKSFFVLKQIKRWPQWKIDIEVGVRLSCVVDDFYKRIFRNLRPSSESESAAGFENPRRFGHRTVRICEMKQREIRDHSVKCCVWKRKILRVAFAKFDSGKH